MRYEKPVVVVHGEEVVVANLEEVVPFCKCANSGSKVCTFPQSIDGGVS